VRLSHASLSDIVMKVTVPLNFTPVPEDLPA